MDVSLSKGIEGRLPPVDLTNIDEEYLCPRCKNILENVHQTYDCGCRFCFECLNKLIESGTESCQACNTTFTSKTKVPDKFFQKKINRVLVACQYDGGCDWKGCLVNYREHYAEHFETKVRVCEYCSKKFNKKELFEVHLDEENGSCQEQLINCPYFDLESIDLQCEQTCSNIKRKDLGEHERIKQAYHLNLVYRSFKQRFEKIESSATGIRSSNASSMLSLDIKPLMSQVSDDYGYSATGSSISNQTDFDSNVFYDLRIEPKFAEVNSKIDMLEINQSNLVNDFTRLTQVNEKLRSDNSQTKETLKEYKNLCVDLQRSLALTHVKMLSLEEKIAIQEQTSYDGTLLWKINNVDERIQDAKSGRQQSFYSPPFYTHPNGYKMCARMYLNGDGQGRGTHASIFFVILKGEYDSLLQWPFKQKCSFVLVDQSANRSNISDAFRPNPNSDSFKRPVAEMNIASGLPLFCPLTTLVSNERAFIKENTMFVKIIVDKCNINVI